MTPVYGAQYHPWGENARCTPESPASVGVSTRNDGPQIRSNNTKIPGTAWGVGLQRVITHCARCVPIRCTSAVKQNARRGDGPRRRDAAAIRTTESSMSTNDPDKHHRFGPPGDRYTGNEEILRIEAKLAAERPPQNAALPIDEDVERKVREWCEDNGLTPAWEVADD